MLLGRMKENPGDINISGVYKSLKAIDSYSTVTLPVYVFLPENTFR